jgi:hypothetical protein
VVVEPDAVERVADDERAELGRLVVPPPSFPNGVRTAETMTERVTESA